MLTRVFLLLLVLIITNNHHLKTQIQKVDFSVKRNYGLPMGKSGEDHWARTKMGYGGGLNLNFFIKNNLSVGFDVTYLNFSGTKNTDHLRVSKELFTYALIMNYFFRNERFSPFLSVGGGFSNETFVYRMVDEDNFFDQLDHINVPLFNIGLGLNIPFSEHTYFIVESRFVNIFSKNSQLKIAHYTEKLNFNTRYLSFFGGLCYEIGKK